MFSKWRIAALFTAAVLVTFTLAGVASAQPLDSRDVPPDPCALFDPF
jgi:hypothetical protein